MTRKDFTALAEGFKRTRPQVKRDEQGKLNWIELIPLRAVWESCLQQVGSACEQANSNFDTDRFYTAAGFYEGGAA